MFSTLVARRRSAVRISTIILLFVWAAPAAAQYQNLGTIYYEYKEKIDQSTNIAPLGDDLFGDSTSYENGATTFSVTDVKAATNVRIPVQLGRTLTVRQSAATVPSSHVNPYPAVSELFGNNWDADVPYIQNDALAEFGWVSDNNGSRCSSGYFSKSATNVSSIVIPAHNFFFGNDINIPGYGKERLLALLPGAITPTDGATYVGTTKSQWKISCLGTIKNGTGEGFLVALPDGAKYYFDWMASADTGYFNTERGTVYLRRFRLYASKATDRFGGTVNYIYDTTYPHRIEQIKSSDGVVIDVGYNSGNGKVASVTLGTKTWTYAYDTDSWLSSASLPDGSQWTYSRSPRAVDGMLGAQLCEVTVGTRTTSQPPGPNEAQSFRIVHPSGAIGDFSFRAIMFGYNRTPGGCFPGSSYRPKAYIGNALYAKSISGAGITAKTWNVSYYPSWSFASECAGCPTTATTVIAESNGRTTTHVYGNDFTTNASQLLSKTISGGGVSSQETYTYLTSATGQPFPDAIGEDQYQLLSNLFLLKNRPLRTRTITQNGTTYTRTVNEYDVFARPTEITRSSAPAP